MNVYKLRWLSLGALLGLLGILWPSLYVLFGLLVFGAVFRGDERTEGNLGRAAAFAYVVTLIAFLLSLLVFTVVVESPELVHITSDDVLAWAFMVIYAVHLLSFTISYSYFDVRGR